MAPQQSPHQQHQHQHQQQRSYFITPWRTHADLLNVRHGLYSPSTPQEQSHAISTVAAWKLRGNVPHAVESTALLMDAMLLHAQFSTPCLNSSFSSSATTTSSFALKAAYTTALSRFVTGFADLGRHRNGPGQTMFDVARSISLPPHFVELRHQVAHEDLPGLARLVRSAREAVNWLWGVYWVKLPQDAWETEQDDEIAATVHVESLGAVKAEATEYLKKFRSKRMAALKKKAKVGKTEVDGLLRETQQSCQNLCCGADEAAKWMQVASILVDDGLIIPSLKQYVFMAIGKFFEDYMFLDSLTILFKTQNKGPSSRLGTPRRIPTLGRPPHNTSSRINPFHRSLFRTHNCPQRSKQHKRKPRSRQSKPNQMGHLPLDHARSRV
jgi:hypothetical protein